MDLSRGGAQARRPGTAQALVILSAMLPASSGPALAAELRLRFDDGRKAAGADVVASLHPAQARATPARSAVMDQRNSKFVPGVLPITLGSTVTFPNSDNIRHQVYSFSPAKRFELPLYAGTPAAPVRFDTAGVVSVGCNILDWMIGWIVVLDTPHFGKSSGESTIALQAPPGRYTLRVWHPRLQEPIAEELDLAEDAVVSRAMALKLAPPAPPRRGNRRLRPAGAPGG